MLACTAFAFAGVYRSTLIIPSALCVILLFAYRPWPARTVAGRWGAELWLALALALCLAQLIPLPGAVIDVVSPHAREAWRRLVLDVPESLPLSLDLDTGSWAWVVAGCALTTFLSARHIFARGGVRRVTRAIGLMTFTLSAIAIAQEATGRGLMYWRWRPIDEGAAPFGPFVNRNHFGTWAILAVPLVLGYLAAHVRAHRQDPRGHVPWRARLRGAADSRALLLTTTAVVPVVAVFVSLSRSAIFGMGVAFLAGAWFRQPDGSAARRRPAWWLSAGLLLAGAAVFFRVDPTAVGERIAAAPVSFAGRLAIWHDTWPVVRDFWLTGTGAGTYETVMLLYQRSMPEVRFNQAHNHYLQLAAEGGLLLAVPLGLALVAFVRDVNEMITTDDSGMYYLRAGAICGLLGVAAQSLFETGLTTPANAFLAAVLAAVVVHVPIRSNRSGEA